MTNNDDSWTSFALTGDPKAYLKYKQKFSHHPEPGSRQNRSGGSGPE